MILNIINTQQPTFSSVDIFLVEDMFECLGISVIPVSFTSNRDSKDSIAIHT